MPAGSPPGGLDRRFLVASKFMESFGSDASIGYARSARNPLNGVILVVGDNDYCGLITDGIFGQPTQGAVLPNATGQYTDANFNAIDGGWIVMDGGNNIFRMTADLAGAVTDITPPAATSRAGVVSFQGTLLVAGANLPFPTRDIEVSLDNGVTWDSDPGRNTGVGTSMEGILTNPAETLVLAFPTGGSLFATSEDGIIWTTHLAGNTNTPQNDGAISDDGTKFCVVSQNGAVATHQGVIPLGSNPFQSSISSGTSIDAVEWIEALQGFILITSDDRCSFVDGNDPSVVIPGSYIAEGAGILDGSGVTDGKHAIWPGFSNRCLCTLREVGDTGLNP